MQLHLATHPSRRLSRLAAVAAALAVFGGSLAVSQVATAATTLPCIPGAGLCPPARPCITTWGAVTSTPLQPTYVPLRNTRVCPTH